MGLMIALTLIIIKHEEVFSVFYNETDKTSSRYTTTFNPFWGGLMMYTMQVSDPITTTSK